MRKQGLTPVSQSAQWAIRSKICRNDWARHEHESLSKILEALLCYDQLNVSNLLGVERICRRLQIWEQAYRNSDVPDFTGVEHMEGDSEAPDSSFVNPDLKKVTADKMKEEGKLAESRHRAKEEFVKLKPNPKKQAKGDG